MVFLRFVRTSQTEQKSQWWGLARGCACPCSAPRCLLGLNDPPLHDARVLAARGDEVAIATEEIDVGDVAAVPAVHVARSLGKNDRERA